MHGDIYLSESDRERIRLTEFYRAEATAALEKKAPEPKWPRLAKLWAILNQPFTQWLVGTAAVGLLTLLWNFSRSAFERDSKNFERVQVLYIEANDRVDLAYNLVRSFKGNDDQIQSGLRTKQSAIISLLAWDKAAENRDPIFEDFRKRTLKSMLYELRSIGRESDRAAAIKVAESLAIAAEDLALSKSNGTGNFNVTEIDAKLTESLNLLGQAPKNYWDWLGWSRKKAG